MSDSPATLPLNFFKSLQKKDYVTSWDCLTRHSQDLIVQMLAQSWEGQNAEQLKELFAKGQGPAKIYWDHFRKNLQLELWINQNYRPLGLSGREVIVKASPADVDLMVFKQGNDWKFGYMETFLERS